LPEEASASEETPSENILRITDELVSQVDRTKKFVIIMIVAIVIAVPITWHVSPLVSGSPDSFRLIGYTTIVIAVVFLAVGVRQWMILSKWTGRYKHFKELQKKVDEKLDFESSGN
jgi:uncharacterized membrane protein YbhN (UPF0104 family)